MGVELRSVIEKHCGAQDQQALFSDFIIARLDARDERAKAALKRIENAALRLPAAEFANEFLGCLLEDADKPMEAMNAFRREGEFADAKSARAAVLRLAIKQKETKTLREMLGRADYRDCASPWIEYEAGELLGDWLMHLRGLARMEFGKAKMASLMLAILAALLWYAVFQRFLKEVPWRWLWPLPMFLAGVGSVAITFYLIKKQESLGIVENGTFPNDLLFFIGGVGLREELSKLAAFALFLPWLLRNRSASAAMLAGAFVGLGFAFEENLDYYAREGFGVVIGRLLTANFMHAAMTSMAGYALYELVRTRFGSAEKSLLTFFAVVVAHGVYDWAPSAGKVSSTLAGGGVVSFVVLGLLAHRFFDELGVYVVPRRGAVTLVALFLMGVSALIALSMMLAAWSSGSLAGLSAVGTDAAGLVPVAVLYVRRFHHG
jgi:RsiW-degrading membrane proteinase PrsW (M82 family)